jgi:hypothetical protein
MYYITVLSLGFFNMTDKNPQTEYDSPWKQILQLYFKDFMLFFFPQAHSEIDWSRGFEFLDKELQQVGVKLRKLSPGAS